MNKRISSLRPVGDYGYHSNEAPTPYVAAGYEYRQRPDERVYEVPVSSVHAVVGPPEQRCWVERQQVVEDHSGPNIPGAIVGGVIGGVLGHQIGSGRGNDVATAGGAVAGAAIGANVNRGGTQTYDRDVQRCETVPSSARPDYWDVTYDFQGVRIASNERAARANDHGQRQRRTARVISFGRPAPSPCGTLARLDRFR
jgi:uncharacterized protein YcfJ